MKLFPAATLKLTGWYLAVLMSVTLVFSGIIYQLSSYELNRPLPIQSDPILQYIYGPDDIDQARQERSVEGRHNLLINLGLLNLVTLTLGAAGSYLFARRTLEPIEEAMKTQARFTSDASHELRTPLAVIQAENEVVMRNSKATATQLRGRLKSNLEEVGRLQQLTDRLLDLSNSQSLEVGPTSIEEACIEALNRQLVPAQAKGISIDNKVGTGMVYSNAGALADILSILLENSVKYSPKNSLITLASKTDGHNLSVAVSDEGPGIAAEDAGRIFERFYRADSSRSKTNVEGYGLGLALAKRLADQTQARLELAESSPKGSTFVLKMPLAR
jgi:signal transduction histidine kinase